MPEDPRDAAGREQRPTTQTVLIVHDGKTHMGLDVQIGKRRIITDAEGRLLKRLNAKPRRRRTDETQGELF